MRIGIVDGRDRRQPGSRRKARLQAGHEVSACSRGEKPAGGAVGWWRRRVRTRRGRAGCVPCLPDDDAAALGVQELLIVATKSWSRAPRSPLARARWSMRTR